MVASIPAYEGDVAPRPTGSGTLVVSDWVQVGRFSVGLDTPALGSEFQRADCAPRSTLGDGQITVADWVQAGRYSVGLDSVIGAGGLTSSSQPASTEPAPNGTLPMQIAAETQGREVRAVNAEFKRGLIGALQVEFDAMGNENALAFTLNYDGGKAVFLDAVIDEDGASGARLLVYAKQAAEGRVAIALALPTGRTFAAGTHRLLTLRFIPGGGEGAATMEVRFDDTLISREIVTADATRLPAPAYSSSTVTIHGSALTMVSAASYASGMIAREAIAAAFGDGLAVVNEAAATEPLPILLGGTTVKVRDSAGVEREAPLLVVSPNQVNFQIPKECAFGAATVTATGGGGTVSGRPDQHC